MNQLRVGIITINWNGYELTTRCVASLLNLQYSLFHIYIVDNNSNNDEGQRLVELYHNDSRITVILNPRNDGYAGGNNVGIVQARSDKYNQGIWCINNDATAEPGALLALVAMAATDVNIGLVGSTILYPDRKTIYALGGGTFNAWSGIDHLCGAHTTFQPLLEPPINLTYISGAALYITQRGLTACPGFDSDYFLYCEELDLALRISRAELRLTYAPLAVVIHDSAATTGHMSATYVYYFLRNRLLLLRKRLPWYHWPTYAAVYVGYYVLGFMVILTLKRKMVLWRYILQAVADFFRHRWGYQTLLRNNR